MASIATIKNATYDNFRVIRATDNYIEKYLPFKMQTLISKNMLSFIQQAYSKEDILNGLKIEDLP